MEYLTIFAPDPLRPLASNFGILALEMLALFVTSFRGTIGRQATKKPGRQYPVIFRRPGCLGETLWAFRTILANGLVLSIIEYLLNLCDE